MSGYSLHAAAEDLVGGAFKARRPAWRRGPDALDAWWTLALLALTGLATSLDLFVRARIQPDDVPAGWNSVVPFLNWTFLPLVAALTGLVGYAVSAVGAWVVLRRRMTFRAVGAAVVLGFWSSVLPSVLVILVALALKLTSDTISFLVALVITVHVVPSLAEMGGLTISRAFLAYLFGPLAVVLLILAGIVLGGFVAKGLGVQL